MKKLLLGISILIFSKTNHAQDKDWTIGLIGSPNFYFMEPYTGFEHSYQTDLGLTIGLEATYSLGNKIAIGLGASLTSLEYQVNYDYVFSTPDDPFIPKSGTIKASYLDIPLLVRINLNSHNKIGLHPSMAINSSILVDSEDQTVYENNDTRSSGSLNTSLISSQLGFGVSYKLSPTFNLKFEPSMRYYFKGFDKLMNNHPILLQTIMAVEYSFG